MDQQHPVALQLQSVLGPGMLWNLDQGLAATVWPLQSFDLVWIPEHGRDSNLRSIWHTRSKSGAQPVIVIAPSSQQDKVHVVGPQDPQAPIRTIPLTTLLQLVEESRSLPRRKAAAVLASELLRLDECGTPGLGIRGLLTKHFVQDRLRKSENWACLSSNATNISSKCGWQENVKSLGYQLEKTTTGYLLRHREEPVAVLHAYSHPSMFSHASKQGTLPEGSVLAECEHFGASWGILATAQRFRLFQNDPPIGAASGRDALIRRALSQLRRQQEEEKLTIGECAEQIIDVVRTFGLEPVTPPSIPEPIGKEDLGVVCYQVVLPNI